MSAQYQRFFHPNGQLRIEIPQVNGRAHGMVREYHSNGQLAVETPNENGLAHGTAKVWDAEGRFLGDYTLDRGTGIVKKWHSNGVLWAEVPVLKGMPTGRQKTWYEDGVPLPAAYWIRGKQVSRKKYLEACKTDWELPQYPETKSPGSRNKA